MTPPPLLTSLLAFAVLRFHAVDARRVPGFTPYDPNIRWIEQGQSVLVTLELPDLPLTTRNREAHVDEELAPSSAVVLNLTVSADKKTLLVQNEPFLPLPEPDVPPHIWTAQIPADTTEERFNTLIENGYFDPTRESDLLWKHVGLSYDRLVLPRDDPTLIYYNYAFWLQLDFIGAQFFHRHDLTLLDSLQQKTIFVQIEDEESQPSNSPSRAFVMRKVELKNRRDGYAPQRPHDPEQCTITSWRCPDFTEPPYYRYVWMHEFSRFYGRKGSMRHFLARHWDEFKGFVGASSPMVLALSLLIFAKLYLLYLMFRRHRGSYQLVGDHEDDLDDLDSELSSDDEDSEYEKDGDSPPSYEEATRAMAEGIPSSSANSRPPQQSLGSSLL